MSFCVKRADNSGWERTAAVLTGVHRGVCDRSRLSRTSRSSRSGPTQGAMTADASWRGLDVTNVNGSLWQWGVYGRLKHPTVSAVGRESGGRSRQERQRDDGPENECLLSKRLREEKQLKDERCVCLIYDGNMICDSEVKL